MPCIRAEAATKAFCVRGAGICDCAVKLALWGGDERGTEDLGETDPRHRLVASRSQRQNYGATFQAVGLRRLMRITALIALEAIVERLQADAENLGRA